VKFAIFLRNVNLGRPGAPTRAQLEQAFADAGGIEPQSFQVNGTLVFSARSMAGAERVLRKALKLLQAECGLAEPGCVRSVEELAPFVESRAFKRYDPDEVYELCLSFACDRSTPLAGELPLDNPTGDVRVLSLADGNALTVSWKLGASPGSPNHFLERATGAAWTTRAIGTIRRLVAKHGAE
jgi:uncharacterized protein (DUF1697 family)